MDVITLFKELLRCPSLTPKEAGALGVIEGCLDRFEILRMDQEGVSNLFAYRRWGDGPHLCFAGHIDVVPAGEGWLSDPFEPMEQEGYLYARGAQDMKSGVSAMVHAVASIESFAGTLSLLITSDEEGEAQYGTIKVLEYLAAHHLLPDAVVIAEPTCETRFGDAIKVGRRGSINGVLELLGQQGHAAYPEKAINPIHQMAPLLERLAGRMLDEGDAYFAPSQLIITDLRAGIEATNVTPGSLKMMFNVRNSTQSDRETIRLVIAEVMGDLPYTLTLSQGAYPFMTQTHSPIVRALIHAIEHHCTLTPKLSTAGGTSDARFVAQFGIDVVEFGVINDTIHAPNERTSIAEVESLCAIFQTLIACYSADPKTTDTSRSMPQGS